ncbi:MAG: hypothetical protein M3R38_05960 [Actinomycetota bacterium]|nr:hypothetical protein [Actinomycetota bacterium]
MARPSDRLRSKLQAAMLASASEQNSREGGAPFRAVVSSVSSDGTKVGIRRLHNASPDGITYPLIAGAYPVAVGDRVWCRKTNGGVVVEGRTKRATDRNVPDLANNKLERNGSQRMQVGTNRFEVDRPGGEEVALLRDTGGHSGRAVYQAFHGSNGRRGFVGMSASNELVLQNDHGTRVRSNQTHEAPDFATDGGVTLSSRLSSANGAVGTPNLATNAVDARVLRSHGSDDASRAVIRDSMRTDTVDARVLQGHGTDDAQRAVTSAHLRSNSVNSRVLLGHSTDDTLRAVVEDTIRNGHVTNAKLAAESVTRSKVAPGTVGGAECGDSIKNAATNVFSLRTINNVAGAAAPFHVHSVLYKTWPKAERRRFLDVRRALEGYRRSPRLSHLQGTARLEELDRRLDTLAEALLGFYRIETDDLGMNAYEVEALLDDPRRADEAKRYKDAHRMDDWEYEKGRDPIPDVAGRLEMHAPGADGKEREVFRLEAVANFKRALARGGEG